MKKNIYDMTFVHLGCKKFDINSFDEVLNSEDFPYKPTIGGYWASPENEENNWENTFVLDPIQKKCKCRFKVKENSKVLIIKDIEDLDKLPTFLNKKIKAIDFEKLSKTYDAILYIPDTNEQIKTILQDWACKCIYVMNPKCMEIIENKEI